MIRVKNEGDMLRLKEKLEKAFSDDVIAFTGMTGDDIVNIIRRNHHGMILLEYERNCRVRMALWATVKAEKRVDYSIGYCHGPKSCPVSCVKTDGPGDIK